MRKLYTILLLFVACMVTNKVFAYDFTARCSTGQTLYFNILSDAETLSVEVTTSGSTNYLNGDVEIPSTVTSNSVTYTVTRIGDHAFDFCQSPTTIVIPNSVTSIGNQAFYYCSGLTTMTIPESVTYIDDLAFSYCMNMTTVYFNATNCTYMGSASGQVFNYCRSLTTLIIGENVTNIPENAFAGCTRLETVNVPSSVASIGSNAFGSVKNVAYSGTAEGGGWGARTYNGYVESPLVYSDDTKTRLTACYVSATSVEVPNTVTEIGSYAFQDCASLRNLTLPTSVTTLGSSAFSGCTSLLAVYNEDAYFYAGPNNSNYTECIIPEGIKKIHAFACQSHYYVTTVTIPSSVTYIGQHAFSYCSSLTTVNYNATNSTHDSGGSASAFYSCSNLTTINIGDNVEVIPYSVFCDCSGVTSITLPSSLREIGQFAFYGCTGLTSITIPENLASIDAGVFYGCTSLTTVNYNAINCSYIGSLYEVFRDCPVTTLNIGENVTSIPNEIFKDLSGLQSITIPENVTTIGTNAFNGCEGLGNVTIGRSVESIGSYAFRYCDNITEINMLAETPPTINSNTFTTTVYGAATVITPCPAAAVYRSNSQWGQFANIQNEHTSIFNIDVQTEDANKGDVAGDGSFTCDTEVILTATANDGYRFLSWDDGNEDNPRTIIVEGDRTYVASFKAVHTVTATAGENGSIDPSGAITVDDGASLRLTFLPNTGYRIASVIIDGTYNVTVQVYNNVYTLDNITTDRTIAVEFEEIPIHTIAVTANEYGTVSPSGDVSVPEGSNQSFTFTPNTNCRLVSVVVDGSSNVTGQLVNGVYTFVNVAADHTIVATFEEIPSYTISVSAGNHGTISPSTNVTVMEGGSQTFTFSADACYEIGDVRVDGATVRLDENNTYTFTNVTANHTVEATFDILTYTISVTASEHGSVTHNDEVGDAIVNCSDSQSFTIEADDSSQLSSVIVDGQDVTSQLVDGVYTFTNVNADHTLNVIFEAIPLYTFTVMANNDEYGTVSGGGQYMEGTYAVISATPNDGYRFVTWDDDVATNPRSIRVIGNRTYVAIFERDQSTITVLPADSSNGSVTGGGTYDVGATVTLTAIPNAGFRFLSWNDDNTDNPRTIVVNGDSTFVASFKAIYTITVLANNNEYGTVSAGGTFDEGEEVTLTAEPSARYCFIEWNDGNTDNPRTVTATSDITYVADFSRTAYLAIDTTATSYLTIDNHTFYASGMFSYVRPSEFGCDTIVNLNLRLLDEPKSCDISPNPANNIISISSENFISSVEIYSTTGRLVMQKEINAYSAEMDIEWLVSGVYFVRLFGEDGGQPVVQRFLKE
ncbi:MAG: leucine-rich repeat domain-containing protein [Bacteroidales bacterium]|nr:leucine-rich repeat domain-containing protein [Bacteroidales bacterium]